MFFLHQLLMFSVDRLGDAQHYEKGHGGEDL